MKGLMLAIQFLTIFPVGRVGEAFGAVGGEGEGEAGGASPKDLSASMAWYPVVGAVQGFIAAVVWYALSGWLAGGVMAAVLLAVLTLSNGGFHLDGFADTVDGLAGGSTPEERLSIMRDHTTGAVGVVFIVLVLIVKYAALASLPTGSVPYVLVAFPAAARWAMVPMSCWSGYARKTGGLGAAYANNSTGVLASATIAVVVISLLFVGLRSIPVLAVIGAAVWLMTRFFKRRLGGITGDVFGFVNETAEILFLLGALIVC